MSTDLLQLHQDGHVATILLNRPKKLNALTPEMLETLEKLCADIERDNNIRAVILTGGEAKAFCVGADIEVWAALEPLQMWREWTLRGQRVFRRLAELRQPVIAAVNGYAFGGGLELALTADIRIAAKSAKFAMPEVKIATAPGWAGSSRLPASIGSARAKQMIFTGNPISAEQALHWGLVNAVHAPEQLAGEAEKMALAIAANAPVSVQLTKQLVNANSPAGDAALEAMAGAVAAATQDANEGTNAFAEKRQPKFKGE